jgi:amino-acid N-acetyltransferase
MEAKENGIDAIFAFTYVPQFFHRVGFSEVERGELPLKVWKDCLRCPKFAGCDEIAVIKRLNPSASIASNQRLEPELNVIQLPILANKQH